MRPTSSRLDTLQAALLQVKLRHLPAAEVARQARATRYDEALAGLPGLHVPARDPRSSHVFHQYTLRLDGNRRDTVQEFLRRQGVPTAVYYPLPLHLQPAYAYLGYRAGDFPVAEALCRQALSLPVHPALSDEQQAYIVAVMRHALGAAD